MKREMKILGKNFSNDLPFHREAAPLAALH
jgi:hypothetical protein